MLATNSSRNFLVTCICVNIALLVTATATCSSRAADASDFSVLECGIIQDTHCDGKLMFHLVLMYHGEKPLTIFSPGGGSPDLLGMTRPKNWWTPEGLPVQEGILCTKILSSNDRLADDQPLSIFFHVVTADEAILHWKLPISEPTAEMIVFLSEAASEARSKNKKSEPAPRVWTNHVITAEGDLKIKLTPEQAGTFNAEIRNVEIKSRRYSHDPKEPSSSLTPTTK